MLNQFPMWSGEMNRLRDEMNRVFGSGFEPRGTSYAVPPINVWEDDDNLFVEAEVPGLEIDEVEIFANDTNQLTLQGHRKQPNGSVVTRHREERSFGKFTRIIELPVAVDSAGTKAEYNAGVLKVTLPKKEEAKPRRIVVKAAG